MISNREQIDLTSRFRSFGFPTGICATQIVWPSDSTKKGPWGPLSADCMTSPKGNARCDGPGPRRNGIVLRRWGGGKPRVSSSLPASEPLPLGRENSSLLLTHIPLPQMPLPLVLPDSGFSFYPWSNETSYYLVLIWNEIEGSVSEGTLALGVLGSSS